MTDSFLMMQIFHITFRNNFLEKHLQAHESIWKVSQLRVELFEGVCEYFKKDAVA